MKAIWPVRRLTILEVKRIAGARMRMLRGMEIVARGGQVKSLGDGHYMVRSQRSDSWYNVKWDGDWMCECPDYDERRQPCKHVYAVLFLQKLPHIMLINLNYDLLKCPNCNTEPNKIIRVGVRRNKYGGSVGRLMCKGCSHKFTERLGFEKIRGNPMFVVVSLDLYYKGLSVRDVRHHLHSVYGSEVSHMTIHRWVRRFTELISEYVEQLRPKAGNLWHIDDMVIKSNGKKKYLWNVLDRKTRYLFASIITSGRSGEDALEAIKKALTHSGKDCSEVTLVSDGLKSYTEGARRLGIKHISRVKFTDDLNNNLVERLNATLRQRYDRTLGKTDSEGMEQGLRSYYNLVRPHLKLNGGTPSDSVGLTVEGNNRWLSLIMKSSNEKENLDKTTGKRGNLK